MEPQPSVVRRAEQPYVAVCGTVTMQTIPQVADRLPGVFGWLAGRGIAPAGPPFLRAGLLPAGRYAVVTHTGPFGGLAGVTRDLLGWAAARGLAWDVAVSPEGEAWGCRLEIYQTSPAGEPDPAKWQTELAFRLAE